MTRRLNQSALEGVQVGSVTALEVASIAQKSVGTPWTLDGCTDFVYAVTYLAGAPFFDLRGVKAFVNGDPLMPEDTSLGFEVPHSGKQNQAEDGWKIISHGNTVDSIIAALNVGDVVRGYKDPSESQAVDPLVGHEFIVTKKDASGTWVVDNTGANHAIAEHLITTSATLAYLQLTDHVYISRIDPTFAFVDDYEANPRTSGAVSIDGGQVSGKIISRAMRIGSGSSWSRGRRTPFILKAAAHLRLCRFWQTHFSLCIILTENIWRQMMMAVLPDRIRS